MTEKIKILVESLIDNSTTDFDLYAQRLEDYILYAAPGYCWYKDELERLLEFGVGELFTDISNTHLFDMYQKVNHLPAIDYKRPPTERLWQIEDVGASFVKCLHEGSLTPSCVHVAENIAKSLVQCIQEQMNCVQSLKDLAHADQYVFHHSVRVAAYATAIAAQLGINKESHLIEIAMGGIFHDIGKSQISPDIIHKNGPLNNDEWEVMRAHPESGLSLFQDYQVAHVPQEIIVHHHERLDGSGYPHGLTKRELLPEVQIAGVADIFDALTSVRSYQKSRSKIEALEFIKTKLLGSHVSSEIFYALVNTLAK